MANWAFIKNGEVKETHDSLPECWENISNFFALENDTEYLQTLGWVAIVHPEYSYDLSTQRLENRRHTLDGMTVTEEWDVVDIPIVLPDRDSVEKLLMQETQTRLDNFARSRGYDNILSACSYATDINPSFQAEGVYCVEARSQTWSVLYQIIADIRLEVRPLPSSFADIESELPPLIWPE